MQRLLYISQGFDYNSLSKKEFKELQTLIDKGENKFKYCVFNVAIVLAIYFIFGLNPIAFISAFIITDLLNIGFDFFTFRIYPTKILPNFSTKQSKKRIKDMKDLSEKLMQRKDYLIDNYCNSCYAYPDSKTQRSCDSCKEKRDVMKLLYLLEKAKKTEVKRIEEIEIKEKKALMQKDEKKSSDYENKLNYFETTVQKIDFLKKKYDLKFLSELKISIEKLIDIIQKKDNSILMVNRTTYLYLDELQKILNKVVELDGEKKQGYINDIKKISHALTENINNTITRIEKSDIEDIDVGISVLMQELLNENEGEVKNHNV